MNQYDPILYGHDMTTHIVSVEPVQSKNLFEVFFRGPNGVSSTFYPCKHHFLVNDQNPMIQTINGCDIYRLSGNGYYNLLVESDDIGTLFYHVNSIEDREIVWSRTENFLTRSGKTLFKGMSFEDPLVLAVDIETLSSRGFSNAEYAEDEIIIISMKDNRGNEYLLHQRQSGSEEQLLKDFIFQFLLIDPDIVIGHNFFGFDIPFIKTRCERYNIQLSLGRNGSEPTFKNKVKKLADKRAEYVEAFIYGRHVLDTLIMAKEVDSVARKFESYGLKYLAKAIGKAKEDRVYVEGKDITNTWHTDPDKLLAYAMDDVDETIELYRYAGGSLFASAQFIPMTMQDVFSRGTSAKIEAIFRRYYLSRGHSWSRPEPKRSYGGGYADIFKFGLAEGPLVYADVDSLYPSLAETLHIQPKREELGYFQKLLHVLKAKRFELKALIKSDPTNASKHKATDGAVKVLLNTMSYGYLGYEYGAFNDYDEAERITTNGQNILKKMIEITDTWNGESVKCDTDGLLLRIPDAFTTADEFVQLLSNSMPEGINISNDGEYARAILFDKKSYILVHTDGTYTMKGNTLRGRSIEKFGKDFIKECVDALLEGNKDHIPMIYEKYKSKLENKELTSDDVAIRKDLKISLAEYQRNLKSNKNFNAQPQYEVAMKQPDMMHIGDTVTYYVKEPPMETVLVRNKEVVRRAKQAAYQKATNIDQFNKDYDVEHYIKRLQTHVKRFMALYTPEDFTQTFNLKLYKADRDKYSEYYESSTR
jgi:DNA polymerase I